jgi:hypothetical protein
VAAAVPLLAASSVTWANDAESKRLSATPRWAGLVCPRDHPVAVPKPEFKMAWPVNGDMSKVRFAGGAGSRFHHDFVNAWDERTLAGRINADGRVDQPASYVLNSKYVLP